MADYLDHGSRHRPGGSDPIPGLTAGTGNDWVIGQAALGTVSSGVQVYGSMAITYQTDGGSVFGTNSGTYNSISMLQTGTYLVRAKANYAPGHAGAVMVGAVIGGDVTTYDYFTAAGSISAGVSSSTGEAIWEQLCVVNDLSAAAGAYVTFEQTTGVSLVGCVGYIQIFRLT